MENQRIRLTKTLLKDALIEIMAGKRPEKITIYEICEKAQINRTTFYKYYGNQYDLLEDIKRDVFTKLNEYLCAERECRPEDLRCALDYIQSQGRVFRVLINSIDDSIFCKELFNLPIVKNQILEFVPANCPERQVEYTTHFFCYGGYAMIKKWINDGFRESPEEIALLLSALGANIRENMATII